jgi:phosphatase NudJ
LSDHPDHFRIACSMLVRDVNERILIVREGDSRVRGKINLPGGHVKPDEGLVACAERECREETGLAVQASHLLGAYVQSGGINFVFLGLSETAATMPGHDILSCEWLTTGELLGLPDSAFLRPRKMRQIISDVLAGAKHSTGLLRELGPELWE